MTVDLTTEQVLLVLGGVVVLAWLWRAASRKTRRAADAVRAGGRVVSLVGRVTAMGAAFVGVQWLVVTYVDNVTLLLVVLALPDLIAAHVLTRALTVTEMGTTRRQGERR